jgi:hypothetical protein
MVFSENSITKINSYLIKKKKSNDLRVKQNKNKEMYDTLII